MLFQEEPPKILDIYESLSLGLYFTVVGYLFLLAVYFLLIRYRNTKRNYWLFFGLFFVFLTLSRSFFIVHDFFVPEPQRRILVWRIATIFAWCAVSMLAGILSILLFTGKDTKVKVARIVVPLLPLIVVVVLVVIPNAYIIIRSEWLDIDPNVPYVPSPIEHIASYPAGRFWINVVILPLITILVPVAFVYLGVKSVGVIRRSSYLNGLGFLIYYVGRSLQNVIDSLVGPGFTRAVLPPLVILLGILFIVLANQYEHLK